MAGSVKGGRGSSGGVTMKQWNDRYYFNGKSRTMDDALGSKIYFNTKTNEVVVQSTQKKGGYTTGMQFSKYSLDELNKFENSAIGSYEKDKFKNISKLVKRNFGRGTGSTSTSNT